MEENLMFMLFGFFFGFCTTLVVFGLGYLIFREIFYEDEKE